MSKGNGINSDILGVSNHINSLRKSIKEAALKDNTVLIFGTSWNR